MLDIDRLAAVLEAAGPAHHAAYIEANGDDPEWPLWYAGHVLDDARAILGRPQLTLSRLVAAFVAADQVYRAETSPVPWPRFYAQRFAEELA
jgi:hypothetical protein